MDFNGWWTAQSYEHPIDPRWTAFVADQLGSRMTIADVGGGPGRYALALCQAGFRATVYDASEAMVEEARRLGVEAYHADAESLPIEDRGVEAVIMRTVVHHLRSPEECFVEARRVLRSDGLLLIQTRSEQDLRASPTHLLLNDEEMLQRDWQRWQSSVHLTEILHAAGFGSVDIYGLEEHEGSETREALVRRVRLRGGDSFFHSLDDDQLDKIVTAVISDGRTVFHRESQWTIIIARK